MAPPVVRHVDAQVLAQREPGSFVREILVVGAGGQTQRLADGVVAVGGPGTQLAVRIQGGRPGRVVQGIVPVAVLVAEIEVPVAVDVLERIEAAVAVDVLVEGVDPAVAVQILARDPLAGARHIAVARQRHPAVPVPILVRVQLAVAVRVLEDGERPVAVEVLTRIALGRLDEAVVIAVVEQDAIVIGVGIEGGQACRSLVETGRRRLERHVRAEDRGGLERHDRPPHLRREPAVQIGEAVEPLVQVGLRIVVDRQGQAVVGGRLPGQLGELPQLPGARDEGAVHRVHRLLLPDVLVGDEEPGVIPEDRPLHGEKRQEVVERQLAQPLLAESAVQARVVDSRAIAVQQGAAPVELERPLEIVPPRFRDDVGESPLRPAVFRGRAGGLDLDLLDRFDVELRADLAGQRVARRNPVDQGDDVGVPGAVDVRIAVPVRVGHARRERQDILVVPAEDRQGVDELGAEPGLGGRALEIDDLGAGAHLDPLAQRSLRLQHQVERRRLTGPDLDMRNIEGGEAREDGSHEVVRRRGEGAYLEHSGRVGQGAAPADPLRRAGDDDRHAGERAAPIVAHDPAQRSARLGARHGRGQCHERDTHQRVRALRPSHALEAPLDGRHSTLPPPGEAVFRTVRGHAGPARRGCPGSGRVD